jgi:hypothetical protein
MASSNRPGAGQMTVESISDAIRLLFDWLAGPDSSGDPNDNRKHPDVPPGGETIDTEGEDAP